MTNFMLKALPDSQFSHLFAMSDSELRGLGAVRMIVDEKRDTPAV